MEYFVEDLIKYLKPYKIKFLDIWQQENELFGEINIIHNEINLTIDIGYVNLYRFNNPKKKIFYMTSFSISDDIKKYLLKQISKNQCFNTFKNEIQNNILKIQNL